MNKGSAELADRINVLVAFQNGEIIQHRGKDSGARWIPTHEKSSLSFNFREHEYRLTPEIQEGWVRLTDIHSRVAGCDGSAGSGKPCVFMREVS